MYSLHTFSPYMKQTSRLRQQTIASMTPNFNERFWIREKMWISGSPMISIFYCLIASRTNKNESAYYTNFTERRGEVN